MEQHKKTVRLVFLAVLAAIVLLLQFFAGSVKIGPTSFSVVLIPITLGAMLLGPWAGAVLGLLFGVAVTVNGLTGADPFTFALIQYTPFLTIFLCLFKGTCAGFAAGWAYRWVKRINPMAAAVTAAATAPLVNTGIFALGAIFGFRQAFAELFGVDQFWIFLFVTIIGINFLVEMAVNLVFSPALAQVVKAVDKMEKKK
ncbi:MAG: ECF transporter S component [Clostridia bacterium]|nr:ECF transporter S component [Clostridia bacterium]